MADVGVKLKVDGEKEFRQAIKECDSAYKAFGSELKLAQSLMAATGDQQKYLQQQSEALNKLLETQNEKVKTLEDQLSKAKDQYGENSTQAQKLQTQLNNSRNELVKLAAQYSENNAAMKSLDSQTDDLEDETEDLTKEYKNNKGASEALGKAWNGLKSIGAAVGNALLEIGKAAVSAATDFAKGMVETGMQFESSMSQVAATMGYTMDELNTEGSEAQQTYEKLTDFAMEMGKTTQFSASQAADALNYMALAGYDADTSISMLPNVLNLAAAGGMELATASDMVTDAQSALGLSLEETTTMVDQMAKTASKSNTSVQQLGEAFLTVGGTAKNLKGGTMELSTALGILADNGIKGSEGGTALRNIILSLTAPTEKAYDTMIRFGGIEKLVFDEAGNMRSLNDIFSDLNGIMDDMTQQEKIELMSEMFNKRDMKSVEALLANTVTNVGDLSKVVEGAGVSWEKYKDAAWMANGGIESLVSQAVYGSKTLGQSMEEMQEFLEYEYDLSADDALTVIQAVNENMDQYGSRWEELSGYIDDATGAAQAMAEVQLNNLSGDITKMQSAWEGFNLTIYESTSGPMRDVIQCVTNEFLPALEGLVAGTEATGASMSIAITNLVNIILNEIISALPSILDMGIQIIETIVAGLMQNMPKITETAVSVIRQLAESLVNMLPSLVSTCLDLFSAVLEVLLGVLPDLIPVVVEAILTITNKLIDCLPMVIDAAIQIIVAVCQGLADGLPKLIPAAIDAILTICESLIENLPMILEAGLELILGLATGLIDALPMLIERLPDIIIGIVDFLVDSIPEIITAGIKLLTALVTNLPEIIITIVEKLPEIIMGIVDAFTSEENIGKIAEAGMELIEGLWKGIQNMGTWLWEQICGLGESVVGWVCDIFGIHSPSTVFAGIGENLMKGLEKGIDDESEQVMRDVNGLAEDITASMNLQSSVALSGTRNGAGARNSNVINIYPQQLDESTVDYLFQRFNVQMGATV